MRNLVSPDLYQRKPTQPSISVGELKNHLNNFNDEDIVIIQDDNDGEYHRLEMIYEGIYKDDNKKPTFNVLNEDEIGDMKYGDIINKLITGELKTCAVLKWYD